MFFAVVGVAMIALKFFGVGSLEEMSWWWCLVPFLIAAAYWEVVDGIFHKRDKKQMEIHDKRLKEQRKKLFEEGGCVKKNYAVIRGGENANAEESA